MGENELVRVGSISLQRVYYKGVPVLTNRQIAQTHGKTDVSIRSTFSKNKRRFTLGTDYYAAESSEGRQITGNQCPHGLMLYTVSGYLKLVKTFDDDRAWDIHNMLLECYFMVNRHVPTPASSAIPATQLDIIKAMVSFVEAQNAKIETHSVMIAELRDTTVLSFKQQKDLKDTVHAKAKELQRPGRSTGWLYSRIWGSLYDRFDVPRYGEIPTVRFNEAVAFVKSLVMADLI